MKFRRFTKTTFLKQIRRPLLVGFFERFTDELSEKSITLPAGSLDDPEYYKAIAALATATDGLPPNLFEAMFGIEGMATEDGQQRLERTIEQSQLAGMFLENSTRAELALQAFMGDPLLFARALNEHRLLHLAKFEYFGNKVPVDRRETFTHPDDATIARMTGDMDAWFPHHNRGALNTRIEVFEMEGEFWFLIRHGDTYSRMPTAAPNRQVNVLHFRPTKDDVVVYSPERDELRIHTGTKGETDLYRKTFGARLFGDDQYFSESKAYTLDPLRNAGADSLSAAGSDEIERVVLREIEVSWGGEFHRVFILRADDLFAAAAAAQQAIAVPQSGRLVRAALEVYFKGVAKPRRIQIRPPNILKLGRHCDAAVIQRWLSDQGFRDVQGAGGNRGGIMYVPPVAEP